jgi:hypothetical protein
MRERYSGDQVQTGYRPGMVFWSKYRAKVVLVVVVFAAALVYFFATL